MLAPLSALRNATAARVLFEGKTSRGWLTSSAVSALRCLTIALALGVPSGTAHAQAPLTNGANHSGSISGAGEVDSWTFTAAQNDAILLSIGEVLGAVDPGFWPWIRLLAPNGSQIGSHFGALAAQIVVAAPLSGTYTVTVASNDSGNDATGDYRLTLAKIPGSPVVPSDDEGGPMTNGANHTGLIHTGDLDQWTFTAAQNDSILLSIREILDEVDPGFWPWMRLYGPNGALVGSHFGALAAQIWITAPLSGTYTVVVSSNDSGFDAEGEYWITLAKIPGTFVVPDGDQGGAMTNGANHVGVIHSGDLDQWTFTAAQNDSILISIREILGEVDPGFWPYIRLFGPTGALVDSHYGVLAAQVAATAPLSGTYTLVVSSNDSGYDAPGDYWLTLAKIPGTFVVPSGDHGGPMTNGANHPGLIHSGDLDQWTFSAAKDDSIIVSIGEIMGEVDPGFWPWIRIYGPNGAFVGHHYGALAAQVWITAPLTGTYTVVVSSNDSGYDAEGQYTLNLAKIPGSFVVPGSDEGGPMDAGVSHPGFMQAPGDLDQWTFYAAQGAAVAITIGEIMGEVDPGFWPWIRLFGPNGAFLGHHWGAQAAQLNIVAPLTGTYTIVVGSNDSGYDALGEYRLQATGSLPADRIAIGLGPYTDGGWFTTRRDRSGNFSGSAWGRLPWPGYNSSGGGLRLAAGDIDGDGFDEIVAGLGGGGAGYLAVFDDAAHGYAFLRWIQVNWPAYNTANGEVWPAVGDLDGDGRAEIVAGLGAGGHGWYEIFDDAANNFAHLAWKQVAWPTYTATATAIVRPAIGNVDGIGGSEIILGLGAGSSGWLQVVNGTASDYSHRAWFQVAWPSYNAANGATFPAAGDLDGDGRAEIVTGLGSGSGGWFEVFEDGNASFAHVAWLSTSWPTYNAANGEVHPTIGNIDGDLAAEIVIGLAAFAPEGGWVETFDNQAASFASLGWRNVDWASFKTAGGATYPAIGRFR